MSYQENNPKLTEMTSNKKQNGQLQDRMDPKSIAYLAFLIILGAFLRVIHVINLDFPLNDGGFFYQLMIDLQQSHFSLPYFSSYNHTNIPFAYPPLGIYFGAILSRIFKISGFEIVKLLPSIISILTIPAFYRLSRKITKDVVLSIAATFGFTFLPTSFDWLIVGGGLTRSFGYLFAILTIGEVYDLFSSEIRRPIFKGILFASLTILSHPGTAWFAFYCSVIIFIFIVKKSKGWWVKSFFVILGTLLVTAPWWLTITIRHGFGVITSPFQTETLSLTSFLTPFTFLFTNEPLLDLLAICGLFGAVICLINHSFFFPAWLFFTFIFESRLGATYAVVPMSLLIGVGIIQGLKILTQSNSSKSSKDYRKTVSIFILGYLIIYITVSSYLGISYDSVLREEFNAMTWIEKNTPESSKFILLTGSPEYGTDHISEWFPTLSQRSSLTTPQGHEWLPNNQFNHRVDLHRQLQRIYLECITQDIRCITSWADQWLPTYTHIYIPISSQYQPKIEMHSDILIAYSGPGGMILERSRD